jgi:hypothetical protein
MATRNYLGIIRFTRSFSFTVIIFVISSLLGTDSVFAQSHVDDQRGVKGIDYQNGVEKTSKSHWYAGARLGAAFIFGLEMQYNYVSRDVPRIYLAAAAQSSLILNTINGGGGVFLGQTGLGVGCRYHHLLWFENEKDTQIQPGYGPEIIWNKNIGTKYLVNLHAGCVISDGSYFPDITFGLLLPLN